MRTIRRSCFETNSSSSHALSISRKRADGHGARIDQELKCDVFNIPMNVHGLVNCITDEYGWSGPNCASQEEKLAYLLTMVIQTELSTKIYREKDIDIEKAVRSVPGFKKLNDFLREQYGCHGYDLDTLLVYVEKQDYSAGYSVLLEDGHGINHNSLMTLDEFLEFWNVTLEEFILCPDIEMEIDHDNH